MGLAARVLERSGIPTVTISSARDITERVKPPRTAFLDYPLGNCVGRPGERGEQLRIIRQTLSLLESAIRPGEILDLPLVWPHSGWESAIERQYLAETEVVLRQRQEGEYEDGEDSGPRVHYAAQEAASIVGLI